MFAIQMIAGTHKQEVVNGHSTNIFWQKIKVRGISNKKNKTIFGMK
jgi:hypothetical protein